MSNLKDGYKTMTKTAINLEQQHSLPKSIFLHLFPGILITIFYIFTAPLFIDWGFPPLFALCLAIPIILVPVELGYLLYKGKKQNNRLSLKGVVLFREYVSLRDCLTYGLLTLVWSVLTFIILQKPVGSFITQKFFYWAPSWFTNGNSFEGSKQVLMATWIMIMVFGNIIGPAIEELYFRGYLLPRISRFGLWAVLLNSILFAVYHFFSPWEVITRIVAILPVSYTAYKKKNIYIGMVVHWILNTLSSVSLVALIFR
jgi:membrane protease YdiL (CAAX protease family)